METVFYNETGSRLPVETELADTYPLALIADTIHLKCHSSSLANYLRTKDHWNDNQLRELRNHFGKFLGDDSFMTPELLDTLLSNIKKIRNIPGKSKAGCRAFNEGIELRKKVAGIFTQFIEGELEVNRMPGLQKLIELKSVVLHNKVSQCSGKDDEGYIKEFVAVFSGKKEYQIFGLPIFKVFRILTSGGAQMKWLPKWYKKRSDAISFELLDLPLVCDLDSDQVLYLRGQLHPAFTEFRNRLDLFRKELSDVPFKAGNFIRITKIFNDHLSNLLPELQKKTDEQIYIQFMRNKKKDYGLKLLLIVAPVSKMIDYYHKTNIVPCETTETVKRILGKEIDLDSCDVFFHSKLVSHSKK